MTTTLYTSKTAALAGARTHCGGLGAPSKMPGYAYGLSTSVCRTGARLRAVEGSTCAGCYAHERGHYRHDTVALAHAARLASIERDLPTWRDRMVEVFRALEPLTPASERFFRWHDSGDIVSLEHLRAIVAIARACPGWRFWLPTKEYADVSAFKRTGETLPENLTVRVSAPMTDQRLAPRFGPSSGVYTTGAAPADDGHVCPAPLQGNACRECRACWDSSVPMIWYHKH